MNNAHTLQTHYRILVSRADDRPEAKAFLFNVPDPIPTIPIPLQTGEDDTLLPLNDLLHRVYDAGGYDLMIDYTRPPVPPLDDETANWAEELLHNAESPNHPIT